MPGNGKWDLTRRLKGLLENILVAVHSQLFEAAVPIRSSSFKTSELCISWILFAP